MDDAAHLHRVAVEQAQGRRLGEHDAREIVVSLGFDGLQIDIAAGRRGDGQHLESCHRGGCGIRAVGGVRYEHLAALSLSSRVEGSAQREHARELSMCARQRDEAGAVQPADLSEVRLQTVERLQRSLHLTLGLRGVREREAGQGGNGLVQPWVVLHRATAEGVEVRVHGEVQLAQVREVTDDLALGYLRQIEVFAERGRLRHGLERHVGGRQRHAGASGAAALHQKPALLVRVLLKRGGRPVHTHAISASAATSRSISSRVLTSVTQSSMPFG